MQYFTGAFIYLLDYQAAQGGAYTVSYEAMMMAGPETFAGVLAWLGISVDRSLIDKALSYSSIEHIREEEARTGPIHAPADFKGSFVRDGRIGQWTEHLTAGDVRYIEGILARRGSRSNSWPLRS